MHDFTLLLCGVTFGANLHMLYQLTFMPPSREAARLIELNSLCGLVVIAIAFTAVA